MNSFSGAWTSLNFYKAYLFGFETLVFTTSGILSIHNQLVTTQRERKTLRFPLSGNRGYHSNRSVPFRAVTRHHGEFSVMGTIFNPAVREATKPVPDTHSAKIEYAHTYFPPIVTLLGELTADRWR